MYKENTDGKYRKQNQFLATFVATIGSFGLGTVLSWPAPTLPQLSPSLRQASIIRLTISYLKLRDFSLQGDPPWNKEGSAQGKAGKGRRKTFRSSFRSISK